MPNRNLTLDNFLAAEANLRLAQSEIIALRELIRQYPNYSGDWVDHPQWKSARKAHRRYVSIADSILRKRHPSEVIENGE